MIVNFSEIINEVVRGLGFDINTIEPAVLTSVKLRINEVQDAIVFNEDWEWRKRTFYVTTRKPYETGTIAVTENDRTITGTGTTWTDSMKTGYLLVNNKLYKIQRIVSSTSLKLEAPYPGDSNSLLSYKIVFPEYAINHQLSAIVNVAHEGAPIEVKHKDRMMTNIASTGSPVECALSDRSKEDFYNTGTVTTNGTTTITGSGTTFTSEMEGMTFKVNEFSKSYTIRDVNNATELILTEAYEGDSGAGKGYKINPANGQLMRIAYTPDDYYFIEVEGLIAPSKLINNNDISMIPNHMPLIHGAIWLAMTDLENKNPIRIQQARADYERTLKQLKSSYRIVSAVRWQSEAEYRFRHSKIQSKFDPLSRGNK